jgi:hypothetical protein
MAAQLFNIIIFMETETLFLCSTDVATRLYPVAVYNPRTCCFMVQMNITLSYISQAVPLFRSSYQHSARFSSLLHVCHTAYCTSIHVRYTGNTNLRFTAFDWEKFGYGFYATTYFTRTMLCMHLRNIFRPELQTMYFMDIHNRVPLLWISHLAALNKPKDNWVTLPKHTENYVKALNWLLHSSHRRKNGRKNFADTEEQYSDYLY